MERNELLKKLQNIEINTGSIVCLGCGHENSCSIKGCAIIRKAVEQIASDGYIGSYKCEACPRVCPEDYQKMVAKASRACQERDTANGLLRREMDRHRWIPVTEQLPECDDDVLVVVSVGYKNIRFKDAIEIASYYQGKGWMLEAYPLWSKPEVSYWMPCPEVPHA